MSTDALRKQIAVNPAGWTFVKATVTADNRDLARDSIADRIASGTAVRFEFRMIVDGDKTVIASVDFVDGDYMVWFTFPSLISYTIPECISGLTAFSGWLGRVEAFASFSSM